MVQENGLSNNPLRLRHHQQQRILSGAGEAVVEEPAPPLAPGEAAPQQPVRQPARQPRPAAACSCSVLSLGCSMRATSMRAMRPWVRESRTPLVGID